MAKEMRHRLSRCTTVNTFVGSSLADLLELYSGPLTTSGNGLNDLEVLPSERRDGLVKNVGR